MKMLPAILFSLSWEALALDSMTHVKINHVSVGMLVSEAASILQKQFPSASEAPVNYVNIQDSCKRADDFGRCNGAYMLYERYNPKTETHEGLMKQVNVKLTVHNGIVSALNYQEQITLNDSSCEDKRRRIVSQLEKDYGKATKTSDRSIGPDHTHSSWFWFLGAQPNRDNRTALRAWMNESFRVTLECERVRNGNFILKTEYQVMSDRLHRN